MLNLPTRNATSLSEKLPFSQLVLSLCWNMCLFLSECRTCYFPFLNFLPGHPVVKDHVTFYSQFGIFCRLSEDAVPASRSLKMMLNATGHIFPGPIFPLCRHVQPTAHRPHAAQPSSQCAAASHPVLYRWWLFPANWPWVCSHCSATTNHRCVNSTV